MDKISIEREDNGRKGSFLIFENEMLAGEMTYTWAGKTKFIIDHTGVAEQYAGKSFGKKLVMAAVDFAREQGVKILPLCPFAKKLFDTLPNLADVRF